MLDVRRWKEFQTSLNPTGNELEYWRSRPLKQHHAKLAKQVKHDSRPDESLSCWLLNMYTANP